MQRGELVSEVGETERKRKEQSSQNGRGRGKKKRWGGRGEKISYNLKN